MLVKSNNENVINKGEFEWGGRYFVDFSSIQPQKKLVQVIVNQKNFSEYWQPQTCWKKSEKGKK